MIALESVSFGYSHKKLIFEQFDWQVARGQSWAVLGPSGCGKTTLLYLLAGLRSPAAGQVRVDNQALTRPRPETGLILQDYGLLPWNTVLENIQLGLRVRQFYGPDGKHAPKIPPGALEITPAARAGWNAWVSADWKTSIQASFRAGSASGWPSPARWSCSPTCC
jgi:ABC-type sugar transport system ATPase subunit